MAANTWALLCRLAMAAGLLGLLGAAAAVTWWLPLLVTALVVAVARQQDRRAASTDYGSARWATPVDLGRSGHVGGRGVILGRLTREQAPNLARAIVGLFQDPPGQSELSCRHFVAAWAGDKRKGELIRDPHAVHRVTVAGTGRGKGVSVVIPALLTDPRSTVVIDPKGENYLKTARRRHERFGHTVVPLDPWQVAAQHGATFNPLDLIDAGSPHLIDEARTLANALVLRPPDEKEPHWSDSAEAFVTAGLAFVLWKGKPGSRHLQSVRELLASPVHLRGMVKLMLESTAHGGLLARLAEGLLWYKDKELASVLTTTNRHLNFLDSPVIAANTLHSSVDFRRLRRRTTVYLIIPGDKLESHARLPRLWLTSLLRFLQQGGESQQEVLFLLDEAGQLGSGFGVLEAAVSLMRSAGVRLHFIFQSLGQVQNVFPGPKAQTFLGNMDCQQYFGLGGDYESAKKLSEMLGNATIAVRQHQHGYSDSRSAGDAQSGQTTFGSNSSTTHSEKDRPLLTPDEILRLPESRQIVFTRHSPPILAERVVYYQDPEFRPRRLPLGLTRALQAGLWAVVLAVTGLLAAAAAWSSASLHPPLTGTAPPPGGVRPWPPFRFP